MTEQRIIKKFIVKTLLTTVPFAFLLIVYLLSDVFKVIYDYDVFYAKEEKPGVGLNAGYVSTTTFEKQHVAYHYDSFIFGNSRSIYYEIADWKKFLPDSSSCFHFDASSESLYALCKKILYVGKSGNDINNVLLIFDRSILEQDKSKDGHLYCIAPQLEDYTNIVGFHCSFIKAFISPKFLYALADYKLSGQVKDYMTKNSLLSDEQFVYDNKSNEIKSVGFEREIAQGIFYNEKKRKVFENKSFPDSVSKPVIGKNQQKMLLEMKRVFEVHHTNYKIVISPLYEQVQLNLLDLEILRNIFGEKNIFNFSGTNAFTVNYQNYYEDSHYRPHVARKILERIYTTN